MTAQTDDQLMARVRAGDQRAFDALYERHRTAVFSFLVRLAGDHHQAEDLLQETFVRVYRARDRYEPSAQFRSWLFTIARRLVVDHARRQHIAWDSRPEALEAASGPERADHAAEATELRVQLERAIEGLPAGQREIVLLSRVAGMRTDEIADVVGSTPGAVRVALHRALRRLATALGVRAHDGTT